MTHIFISDLHLENERPDMTALFLAFLHKHTSPDNILYILGDFFESWIGDDNNTAFNDLIIRELKSASVSGLTIYFMRGNRDFLVGRKFLRASGCHLLPDEYVVNLSGKPTLLMHGDTLCTDDLAYLKFRKKARNWFFQQLFLLKPLKKRIEMANAYREASKAYTSTAPDHLMDVTQHEVERVMQKHNVKYLIHGHTHRPAIHQFELDNMPATRTVLGPWHNEGSALMCFDDGRQELIRVK